MKRIQVTEDQIEWLINALREKNFLLLSVLRMPGCPWRNYDTLRRFIRNNEKVRQIYEEGKENLGDILLEYMVGLSLGHQNKNANIPAHVQMSALQFMIKILRPKLFKELGFNDGECPKIIINATPNNVGNGEMSVLEFIRSSKNELEKD